MKYSIYKYSCIDGKLLAEIDVRELYKEKPVASRWITGFAILEAILIVFLFLRP